MTLIAPQNFHSGNTNERRIGRTVQGGLPTSYGLLVCDKRGKVVLCNDMAAKIFSGDPGEVEGYSIRELLPDIAHGNNPENYLKHYLSDSGSRISWHRISASDRHGLEFQLNASVSKFEVDGVPLFLMRLRHRENA